jgi:hypothetical protein
MNSAARISLDWAYKGLDACVLENDRIRATVIPEVGAKVHELVCKRTDEDVLFHHPRVELRKPPFAANVDDYWTGGIDECIPTGAPCVVGGESLPFLGEAWSMPWGVEQESATRVRLWRDGVITPFRLERTMEVRPGEPVVHCRHTVTNGGLMPIDFLWGIHAGVPISSATWVDLPAAEGVVEDSYPGDRLGATGERYPWEDTRLFDLDERAGGTWDLHYAAGLKDGWLAVGSAPGRAGFGMTFPRETFRCAWIWISDGGWRGTRCMAIEPWTGSPSSLDRAIAAGSATRLDPGESISAEVDLIVFSTAGRVAGFEPDGSPVPLEGDR